MKRTIIIAALLWSGCHRTEPGDPIACRKRCCEAGLFVDSIGGHTGTCYCGNASDSVFDCMRAIQCGEEQKQ